MDSHLSLAEMRAEFERLENQETEIDQKIAVLLQERTISYLKSNLLWNLFQIILEFLSSVDLSSKWNPIEKVRFRNSQISR